MPQNIHLATKKLTKISSGDNRFALLRGSYGFKRLPIFFTYQMSLFCKTFNKQDFVFVNIYNILLDSNLKKHFFQFFEQLHITNSKHNLKIAPEKFFFMLPKGKFLRHAISCNEIKPIQSRIAAIHKIPFSTGKVALLSFDGALNFIEKRL